jgi:hypothetical protein
MVVSLQWRGSEPNPIPDADLRTRKEMVMLQADVPLEPRSPTGSGPAGMPGFRHLITDRRNSASRERLLNRIRAEFDEWPRLALTEPQARRLFGLRDDVCRRIMSELVREHFLWLGPDLQYTRHV